MHSPLCTKILERKEAIGIVESLLVFAVTALDLAVVARSIELDKFAADDLLLSYFHLALLTPYFSAYFIRDCLYRMFCVTLLFIRAVSFPGTVLGGTLTILLEGSAFYFFLFPSSPCSICIVLLQPCRFFLPLCIDKIANTLYILYKRSLYPNFTR